MYQKLTEQQRIQVIARKKEHDDLLAHGRHTEAKQVGIKVIAAEAGIHPSMIYRYMKDAV